ncbi:MAG TPA: DegV family protein [Candidatus Faecousia faecavium]|nr:DegV family protein [Candidatus Faecousia faecavium]
MNYKYVSDSGCNILGSTQDFASVPMKVIAHKEFVDDGKLDIAAMVAQLKSHKGKSGSSCPNVGEWLEAFGDADVIFATTISKAISGSYNAAAQAAHTYMEEHPGRKVILIDSMSAGPQMAMILDKARQLVSQGLELEAIAQQLRDYRNHVHTLFCLESLTNLARNGRVNPAVAKLAGVLGIRVCGEAKEGKICPAHKARGEKKAIQTLVDMIQERGFYDGALLRIAHCFNPEFGQALGDAILAQFPNARFQLEKTGGLCSYYAEQGGLMIAFEGGFNQDNHCLED